MNVPESFAAPPVDVTDIFDIQKVEDNLLKSFDISSETTSILEKNSLNVAVAK